VKFPKLGLGKLGRWQLILLVVVVVVVAALLVHRSRSTAPSGPGRMDAHATRACRDFAHGYAQAKTKSARLSLADKVTASSSKSDNRTIRDKAMAVGRNTDDTSHWRASGGDFLDSCHAAGFSG
jgi:hypothetical protein